MSVKQKQNALLHWFDQHQRIMPWRAVGQQRPDPYHVWLSEIMLQQTTVAAVTGYFLKFIKKWPSVKKLAAAPLDDVLAAWAGLGYYARARNLHKCAQEIMQRGGTFPKTCAALEELPGIGPYTAAAIASIAFDQPAVAVDGNVERVVSRFFAITEPLPLSKPLIRAKAAALAKGNLRHGDFTQAFMELGATVCTPKNPKCAQCPWQRDCAGRKAGIADTLPRKIPKAARPQRHGRVYFVYDQKSQRILIEKRRDKGLYEGLYQLPTTPWVARAQNLPDTHPAGLGRIKTLRDSGLKVFHVFTHFELALDIWTVVPTPALRARAPAGCIWVDIRGIERYALPSLMTKVLRLCLRSGGAQA